MEIKSDIEIAQSCEMKNIREIAATAGVDEKMCIRDRMSKRLGQRIWDELKIPSFLYEDSATRPERRNLATCRKEMCIRDRIGTRQRM